MDYMIGMWIRCNYVLQITDMGYQSNHIDICILYIHDIGHNPI